MKAIVYKKKVLPSGLVYNDIDKPVPGDDEILVKIEAVSLNAADYRSIKMGIVPKKRILGADICGTVESTGKNIVAYKAGDEVYGDLADCGFGGLAEYAVAPERLIAPKPASLSYTEAAALPMAAQTALQGLRNLGEIKKGDDVLIIGTGGGVGTFAVQLSKQFGATVTGVCSTGNIEQTKALGADYVIDYTKESIFTKGQSYDIILAVNGNYPLLKCKRLLKPGGRYVLTGGSLLQIFKAILFGKFLSLRSKKILFLSAKTNVDDLRLISSLADEGKIKPVIDRYYTLDKAAEAMKYLSEGHAKGKVVITV